METVPNTTLPPPQWRLYLTLHCHHHNVRSQEVGEEGRLYLTLHCHHQNDSSTEMGSGENHFNVSFIVRDKVTDSVQKPQRDRRR